MPMVDRWRLVIMIVIVRSACRPTGDAVAINERPVSVPYPWAEPNATHSDPLGNVAESERPTSARARATRGRKAFIVYYFNSFAIPNAIRVPYNFRAVSLRQKSDRLVL